MTENIAIVVGSHGDDHILKGCLESLIQTIQPEDEIILVVNSDAPSIHKLSEFPPQVQCLHFYQAIGNAKAMNVGVATSSAPWIVMADFDLIFLDGWRDALLSACREEDVSIACSMLLDPQTNYASEFGIAYTHFNGAHPHQDLPIDHPILQKRRHPIACCGGGTIVTREAYNCVHGYNEQLGTMYADVDFFLRLRKEGYRIVAEPRSRMYHFGGWTSLRERNYKNHLIKGDHKGAFSWQNADVLVVDLGDYFETSIDHLKRTGLEFGQYVFCNALNVANPDWYEEQLKRHGVRAYETRRQPSNHRDAARESLYDLFGYDTMKLTSPLAYFVDRHISIMDNFYWWKNRDAANDIVIDRNANVLKVSDVLARMT